MPVILGRTGVFCAAATPTDESETRAATINLVFIAIPPQNLKRDHDKSLERQGANGGTGEKWRKAIQLLLAIKEKEFVEMCRRQFYK
jgi:hypothetical protein